MEQVQYVYTTGMSEAEIRQRLRDGEHGVLALADGDEAYGVVLSYHYDGERLLLRVSDDGDGRKAAFLGATEVATLVCHEATTEQSWSVHVRGPLTPWEGEVDETTLNDWFPPFRLFDETVADVEFSLYELGMDSVVGRRTVE